MITTIYSLPVANLRVLHHANVESILQTQDTRAAHGAFSIARSSRRKADFVDSTIHASRAVAVRPGYAASTSLRSVSCSAEARFWAHNQCGVGHTRGCTRAARYELWWALALAQMAEQLWALRLALPQAVSASDPARTCIPLDPS